MEKVYSIKVLFGLNFFAVTDAEVFGLTTHPNHNSEDDTYVCTYQVTLYSSDSATIHLRKTISF